MVAAKRGVERAVQPPARPRAERLLVRAEPLLVEAGPAAPAYPVTPRDAHFVRNHYAVPQLIHAHPRVLIDGAGARGGELTLAELMRPGRPTPGGAPGGARRG